MIKIRKNMKFGYVEKRSDKQLFIDRFYQEYLQEKRTYKETPLSKDEWHKENKDFINKKYQEEA